MSSRGLGRVAPRAPWSGGLGLSSHLSQPMLMEWGGVEWESLLRVLSL